MKLQPTMQNTQKVTKKWVLAEASRFWKTFGHLTFYKTKKQYLEMVLERYDQWKRGNKEVRENMQKRMMADLEVRKTQVDNYLKVVKDVEKLETVIRSGVVK